MQPRFEKSAIFNCQNIKSFMKIELIVNSILIIVGLVGGTLFYLYFDQNLSLIFFSISLAAILYQFLGGINQQNEFNLGAIKFGSSAAVLIGFMFFFKKFIFTEEQVVSPSIKLSHDDWLPVNKRTGEVIQVAIKAGDSVLTLPADMSEQLPSYKLKVKEEDNRFYVELSNALSEGDTAQKPRLVGDFTINELKSHSLYNEIDLGDEDLQIFTLYKDRQSKNSSTEVALEPKLPFEIMVTQGGNFTVRNKQTGKIEINSRAVNKRTSFILKLDSGAIYLLMILQAHHEKQNKAENYSKWLVKKIQPVLMSEV